MNNHKMVWYNLPAATMGLIVSLSTQTFGSSNNLDTSGFKVTVAELAFQLAFPWSVPDF